MEVTILDIWQFVTTAGAPGLLFLALVASMQGRFVWKREYERDIADERREKDELRQERDAWREAYFRASGATNDLIATFVHQARGGD